MATILLVKPSLQLKIVEQSNHWILIQVLGLEMEAVNPTPFSNETSSRVPPPPHYPW